MQSFLIGGRNKSCLFSLKTSYLYHRPPFISTALPEWVNNSPAVMPSWFEYPITRPFTLRYFTPMVLVLGLIWVTFVTLLNVVAVGYEYVPVISTSFNSSSVLWYEIFVPKSTSLWIPKTRTCAGSVIKPNEGENAPSPRANARFGHHI